LYTNKIVLDMYAKNTLAQVEPLYSLSILYYIYAATQLFWQTPSRLSMRQGSLPQKSKRSGVNQYKQKTCSFIFFLQILVLIKEWRWFSFSNTRYAKLTNRSKFAMGVTKKKIQHHQISKIIFIFAMILKYDRCSCVSTLELLFIIVNFG
jgi:hypothetical protein